MMEMKKKNYSFLKMVIYEKKWYKKLKYHFIVLMIRMNKIMWNNNIIILTWTLDPE